MILVRGDLKHRVGAGIEDRLAGADVFLAKLAEDRGAGGVLVAEDASDARACGEGADQFGGKARLRVGEIAPVEGDRHAGDLPVARRGVLAARDLDAVAPETFGRTGLCQPRWSAGRGFGCRAEAETVHVRQVQRPGAQPDAVAPPGSAFRRDMPQRVGPGIAV
jgi:hypothetical protein